MYLVGERKIFNLFKLVKSEGQVIYNFTRGQNCVSIILEAYEEDINISMSMHHVNVLDILEVQYMDVNIQASKYNMLTIFRVAFERLYRLCEIGLYVQCGIWSSEFSNGITLDLIFDYFSCDKNSIVITDLPRGKAQFDFNGMYFGEKKISIIYSKRLRLVKRIVEIKER